MVDLPPASTGQRSASDPHALYRMARSAMFYPKADIGMPDERLRGLRRAAADKAKLYSPYVRQVCADHFSGAPRIVTPVLQWGTFHLIFAVTDPAGREWIMRIADGEAPDFALYLDAWAGENLGPHGVPVPRVAVVDLTRSRAPFEFAIVQRAVGEGLSGVPAGERFRAVLRSLGRTVRRLHAVPVDGFGLVVPAEQPAVVIGRGAHACWADYLMCRLDAHLEHCLAIGAISGSDMDAMSSLLPQLLGQLKQTPGRLLHGDLGSHNVFVHNSEVTGLIDWEDCVAGDPVYDLAFWGTFHPHACLQHFLDGYFNGERHFQDFEIRYWLYYVRVALAKTVLRHRFGYDDLPGRAPASARIQFGLRHLHEVVQSA
jgi:aminoglycoside phosphotransferase (APT) family kinase protein